MVKQIRHIALIVLLLLVGGVVNEAWAAKVTYHILTLPIEPSTRYNHHMVAAVTSHRLEAFKVVVDNQTTVELPAHYKSPLATGFTYYAPSGITIGSTIQLYEYNSKTKGTLYDVKGDAESVTEGTAIPGTTAEYYVIYTYNESNTIAQLDGSVSYNIATMNKDKGVYKDKGFISYNRGRNNRPAVVPTAKVDAEMLASPDFSKIEKPGGSISTYWVSGDNKNKQEEVESQFHFIFRFEGKDPYNIIICNTYNRDYTYIEKNDDGDKKFVYKWYKDGQLFSVGTNNSYIASDIHKRYQKEYNSANPNPTELTLGTDYVNRDGQFHGQTSGAVWGSYALLNNNDNNGYVFMGTRTVDGNGATPDAPYYLKEANSLNNLVLNKVNAENASNNLSIKGIYPIKKVTFKVPTPFYKVTASNDHIISVTDWVSQYTVENDPIETKYLPTSLRRKYCTFNGKFYSDAARTQLITKFSDVTPDPTEGYQIYLGYDVSASIPFKAIDPLASYTTATWYELTDAGSSQEYGRKIKYNSGTYKNNGRNGEYVKESEFAFVGDPYELKVLYRKGTEDASANRYVTLSTYDTWEIPVDAVDGSFLLQKYKGTGYWNWDVGQPTGSVTYQSALAHAAGKDAQTIAFTVSGLNGGKYLKVTTGGTDVAQIVSVTPTVNSVIAETGTTATVIVQLAANTSGAPKTMTVTIQEYDDNEGGTPSGTASVITITQGTSSSSFAGNTVNYHAENFTYVKPMELPKFTYTYNIVDNAGIIAVKGTASQTVFSTLTLESIPSAILSPFLVGETVTFYSTFTEGNRSNLSGPITWTPASNANIYVEYTTGLLSTTRSIKLNNEQQFKVQLNKEYIYYDTDSEKLKVLSTPAVGTGEGVANYYTWRLEGGDPYAMKIYNVGKAQYVKVNGDWGNDKELDFDTEGNASRFIAMMGNYTGIYEVMAASGSTDYYHIGRPSDSGAETKIYSIDTEHGGYAHGADQLRFELAVDKPIQYTLIDNAGAELLTVSSYNPRLVLPADYISPLVDTYYYYPTKAKALTNNKTNNITEITADTDESDAGGDSKDYHVWVRYTVNDLIGFNNSGRVDDHPYLLKFLDPYPYGYYLEDGNDKLIPYDENDENKGRIQAIYPYCNGDGNLNIYGERMRDEQMGGGSSTRPRWVWFFESANNDPYHVRIHSRSTISYKGVGNPTYLQTYAVHFNQDTGANEKKQRVVTGGALPGVASDTPTEYMILGLAGAYKLMTTQPVAADLNGDNDTSDAGENERREVKSLEQYWKTYNMVKKHVLNADEADSFEADLTMPDSYRETLKTKLQSDFHINGDAWHSYDAYANATRWNGYNDKSDGHEKKVVEKLEHWFQTFDMGNGTFNVETADIPPVLVLLDQHGWEIMRRPLPVVNYPEGPELDSLKVYDSPLVDKYYFYSNATKASGCHKYTLRLDDEGKERDQITVNGVHYSSSSLGSLPPANAKGVKSSGVLNDQFVVYTVKEEYAGNYTYNLEYTGNTDAGYSITSETGASQPYLVLQHGRFYKTKNAKGSNDNASYISKPIIEHTYPEGGNVYDMIVSPHNHGGNNDDILDNSGNFIGNNFWYVKPNMNIDEEMGIKWGTANSGAEPLSEAATKVTYKDKSGFDPYNIQLELVNNNDGTSANKYLTTHMTSAHLDNGIMKGDYSGEGGTTKITLEDPYSYGSPYDAMANTGSTGYDHTNLHISNQTFMAVSDENGNMQLMPRFDHTKRISLDNASPWETQLTAPENHAKASAEDNNSQGSQTTFFVRPQRFIYHIIDNDGLEALRYTRGGDNYPAITEHFRSPLATGFKYYKNLILTDGVYQEVLTKADISEKEITGSFAGSFAPEDLNTVDCDIYVRYSYDDEADHESDKILQGQWFTVKLNSLDLQSSGTIVTKDNPATEDVEEVAGTGVSLYAGEESRSLTATNGDDVDAQAKKLTATGNYYFKQKNEENYWLVNVTVAYNGSTDATYTKTPGSYSTNWANSKPLTVDADAKKWQWKFLAAPSEATLPNGDPNPYYVAPDPYSVKLYNREANYSDGLSEPNPMGIPIKVPNDASGTNRFALLSHPSGGYALAVAKTYTASNYQFLNGAIMSTTVPAITAEENYQRTVADNEEYATEKAELSNGVYYFKINSNVTYKKVTVTTSEIGAGVAIDKTEWDAAEEGKKKTVAEADFETERTNLQKPAEGEVTYYFKITSSTVTYNKVTVTPGPSVAEVASTVEEWTTAGQYQFTMKTNNLSPYTQILVDDDVTHSYTYYVITNEKIVDAVNVGNKLAITGSQTNDEAASHDFAPYLPENIQTPLFNMDDYKYYGSATISSGIYTVADATKLFTLYGLYDDVVYVRYNAYDPDKTSFKVPNVKGTEDGHVAKDPSSHDASMNIEGGLPYNIIWYNDNMMKAVDNTEPADDVYDKIGDGGSQSLSGNTDYVWYFTGGDPYALKIKHKDGKYVNGTATLVAAEADAKQFMLLRKSGYDYGVLQEMGGSNSFTFGDDDENDGTPKTFYLTEGAPEKFIIFGLSVHDLIYRLIIAKTCPDKDNPETDEYVDIPYREGDEKKYTTSDTWLSTQTTRIFGTTQRNLTSKKDDDEGNPEGSKYQLGGTVSWGGAPHIYSKNVGTVSIGDDFWVPNEFYRPNCTFEFYIEGVYNTDGTVSEPELDNRFKGLKLKKLMSASELIDKTVVVNIVYHFNDTLATNTGLGFVTSKNQNLWYTFETYNGSTPYLAHYTNAWGLQSMAGRETRYTNDYLWTPLGDPYGFKMYNRYMLKNSGGTENVMTMNDIVENENLYLAEPGTTLRPVDTYGENNPIPSEYAVFELLRGDADGYFRVHPMANNSGTQYYVRRGGSDYAVLSTTPSDWAFGLDMTLLEPYHQRAGYVGGLTPEGKTAYENVIKEKDWKITDLQKVVYNDENIVPFKPGYYRLHNQPGVSGISPVRYASGYLHKTELTPGTGTDLAPVSIPMHFYSRKGVKTTFAGEGGLGSGFTVTNATRGEIPVDSTECDPSTIFYFPGNWKKNGIPRSIMQTQGLYVAANAMGDGDNGTKDGKLQRAVMSENITDTICFSLMDIGGAVLLIHDGEDPSVRRYLNFDQSRTDSIYDLKYYHNAPTDDAKWCLQPVQKSSTAGNNEMPLKITTNNGGDGYYYTTFYAPFDVELPSGAKGAEAFVCTDWDENGIHPTSIGQTIPAETPVIIRTRDESGIMTLVLPNASPSPSPSSSCVFTGEFLEQLLEPYDADRKVYTFGLYFTSQVAEDDPATIPGDITAPLPEFANNGVGFYLNATRNKEASLYEAMWKRNNRYVLHNKIYYRATGGGGGTRGIEFVPVIFDDENQPGQPDIQENVGSRVGDGRVYDLQGRCVATEEQVQDGTWRQNLRPGIYIINGKKIKI